RRDIDADGLKNVLASIDVIEREMREITSVFLGDSSVKARLCGVGVLSKQDAHDLGCVGPMSRASGISQDLRQLGYGAFKEIQVEPVTRKEGDCYARCAVRCAELVQSVRIRRAAIERIHEGEVSVKVTGTPSGETIARTVHP